MGVFSHFYVSLIVLLGFGAAQAQHDDGALRLGSGRPAGSYHNMAADLTELVGMPVKIVASNGTLDNLEMLKRGEIDVAIVQNDLAHYVYRGSNGLTRFSGFKNLLPLFPEYVQIIVRRDADIGLLGELRGRRVSVGPTGSGSYQNAVHVLDEIGLKEGVDFESSYLGEAESLNALRHGELDAAFITGQLIDRGDLRESEPLIFPTRIIQSLSDRFPYYRVETITTSEGGAETYLSVTAQLVISDRVARSDAAALAQSVISRWPKLRERQPQLRELESALLMNPVPNHPAVRAELERAGYLASGWPFRLRMVASALAWMLVLALCLYAVRNRTTYNRLGAKANRSDLSAFQRGTNVAAAMAPWILGLSVFIALLAVSFWLVQLTEGIHARRHNIDNQFIGMDPIDGFMWLFSFVASGFTLQGAFPQSFAGRLIAGFMALVGIMGPVTLIFYVIAEASRSRDRRSQGDRASDQSGHVLICGWNEKAPGIIFSLTGSDVGRRRDVTLVADCDGHSPLDKYKFDQRHVRYCHGDSTDRNCLQRANAKEAENAIVLCDNQHRAKGNLTGILTVMNLRAIRPDMHICAELVFDKNAPHFIACGCNTLISPDRLIARMAVLSTVSPLLIDFIFDVLTFNEEDRFMAETVENLESLTGETLVGRPAYEAHQCLIRRGANVVGLVLGGQRAHGLFDASFEDASGQDGKRDKPIFLPLTTSHGRSTRLRKDHALIFSARNRKAIGRRRDTKVIRAIDKAKQVSADAIQIRRHRPSRVLLFGDEELAVVQDGLNCLNGATPVDAKPAPVELMTEEQLDSCLAPERNYSHVILLANKTQRNACSSDLDLNEIDAITILNTRLIRNYFQKRRPDHPVQITVEALSAKNRGMFKTAGADSIICSLTLVERFLTKEIYERSQVLDYVVALINVTDKVHLYSLEVDKDDTICGKPYASILKSRIEGFRLIGWLPRSQRKNLRNKQGDFEFHFRTVIGNRTTQTHIQPGDQLVAVLDRRNGDWLKRDNPQLNNAAGD